MGKHQHIVIKSELKDIFPPYSSIEIFKNSSVSHSAKTKALQSPGLGTSGAARELTTLSRPLSARHLFISLKMKSLLWSNSSLGVSAREGQPRGGRCGSRAQPRRDLGTSSRHLQIQNKETANLWNGCKETTVSNFNHDTYLKCIFLN